METMRGDEQIIQRQAKWTEQLHAACQTLSHVPEHLIRSISVTDVFRGTAEDGRWLEALGKHVAGEYGLLAQVQFSERHATVFLRRVDAATPRT